MGYKMRTRDTNRLLLHRKGERLYFGTTPTCPREHASANDPSVGIVQSVVIHGPFCLQLIGEPLRHAWVEAYTTTVGGLQTFLI
jgi:hypothetical protein